MEQGVSVTFRVAKRELFTVRYNKVGSNEHYDFATSMTILNYRRTDAEAGGQCQLRYLDLSSVAGQFYTKWNPHHLQQLTPEQLTELHRDLRIMRHHYPSIKGDKFERMVALDREVTRVGAEKYVIQQHSATVVDQR